jgi:prevent-host-death family protein
LTFLGLSNISFAEGTAMKVVTIAAAKSNLPRLIAQVEAGEEIIIVRGKVPVAKLVPVRAQKQARRKFGALKGKFSVGPEFFEPLPEDELKGWE